MIRGPRGKRIRAFLGPALPIVAVTTYLVWIVFGYIIWRWTGYVLWGTQSGCDSQPGCDVICQGLGIDGHTHPASIPPQIVCILFAAVNIVRVWMGITFLHNDRSFRRSVRRIRSKSKADTNRIADIEEKNEYATLALLVVSFILGITIKGSIVGVWGIVFCFSLESIILLYIDKIWWKILITKDIEKAANKFIVLGDWIVCLFAISFFMFVLTARTSWQMDQHWQSAIIIFLFSTLSVIFGGEIWSQYWLSLRISAKLAFRRYPPSARRRKQPSGKTVVDGADGGT